MCRPRNKEELFNRRHAAARKVIERTLHILKERFRILQLASEYNTDTQARIPAALCAIHNFIAKHDSKEGPLSKSSDADEYYYGHNDGDNFVGAEPEEASAKRDRIAEKMWQSYQKMYGELEERFDDGEDEDVDF